MIEKKGLRQSMLTVLWETVHFVSMIHSVT